MHSRQYISNVEGPPKFCIDLEADWLLILGEVGGKSPGYAITNTQRIRIYLGKLKLILVKISQDPGRLHGKHAKENQTLFNFLLLRIYPDSPVHTSANTERIQICPVMLQIYPGKCIYTVI